MANIQQNSAGRATCFDADACAGDSESSTAKALITAGTIAQ
jgi:hypothetical protein